MITDNMIRELSGAFENSTKGMWKKGQTSHETVTQRPESSINYHIGEFYHANDAAFCEMAHKHMPAILSALESIRWIPVTERLPKPGERVLMVLNNVAVFEGYTNSAGQWFKDGNKVTFVFGESTEVTHWMPLPEAKE